MNIAFPALVVLLLLLPGVLFSYAYRRGTWSSPISFGSVSNEVARGALFALPVHLLTTLLAESLGPSVDYEALALVLTGRIDPATPHGASALRAIADHPRWILSYFAGASAVGFVLGLACFGFVRTFYLDLRLNLLRFDNPWYYLLSGEAEIVQRLDHESLNDQEIEAAKEDVGGVYISAVVEQGGAPVLYWGTLSDFYFDSTGALDFLVLQEAYRRPLVSGDDPERDALPPASEDYYYVRGDYFVLPYADIKTLNVDYFYLVWKLDAEADEG
jgi:hypothetical protein